MRFAKLKEIESGTYQVQSIIKSATVPFSKDLIEIPQDINDEQVLYHFFTPNDWFMSSQWSAVSTNQRGSVT
ncbi:MAG TPA: hypothetical protein VNX68_00190, partial [Nitrosopumilaceae archaeon]|nr:hypothetical protein [Nitrosopumilaceae archaeon]